MALIKKAKLSFLIVSFLSINLFTYAQDLSDATKAYNDGVEMVGQEKLEEALAKFIECVEICEALEDEESMETKMSAEGVIPGVQFRIAVDLLKEKNFDAGIPALQKTIELADEYNDFSTKGKAEDQLTKVYYSYAGTLMKKGDFAGAEENFNKVIEINPNFASVYMAKALLFKHQDNEAGFKENIDKAIEVAKSSNDRKTLNKSTSLGFSFYYNVGVNALKANEYDKCVEGINTALTYNEKHATAMFMLVQAYNKLGDSDKAIEAGNNALAVEADVAEKKAKIYFEIANAYKEKGDNDLACENFKKAMYGKFLENAKYQREHILKCTN